MGDVKLAMAVGAILGPLLGSVAMLVSALAGGVMAMTILTVHGRGFAPVFRVLTIGVPFMKRFRGAGGNEPPSLSLTMPYGLAIGVGTLFTLAMCWWTGRVAWFL